PGVAFVDNLVPNATFNEGTDAPAGWRIEGDNANGAAVWQDGDAFSGRRSLKIDDRGPYVRSDEDNPSVYVSGGRGGGGSRGWSLGAHREEVSARWVSEPSPAQAGAVYQTMAFMQFANQDQYDQVDVHRAVNPVRIQFLDAAGKVLPYPSAQDWLHNEWPLTGPPQLVATANQREGWARVLGIPVVAPGDAVSVRVAVVLTHALYAAKRDVEKLVCNHGSVLVDNVALYQVRSERKHPEEVFWDTVEAGGLPFVPTSAAHRPDTLNVESDTGYGGGILFAPANPRSKPLKLRLQNYIADPRQLEIRCEIVDWRGQHIFEETLSATLPPFGTTAPSITYPDGLPLGAYTISYVVREAGVDQDQGFTRFAVLAKRETTPEERGRMDYAFSIFAPFFPLIVGYPEEEMIGQMYDAAGVGSTWYSSKTGAGYGVTDLAGLVSIKDPAARQQAVEQFIAESREVTAAWRRYGVKPMGRFTAGIPEDERPILAEVVTQLVTALKNDIRDWQWAQSGRDAPVWENYRVAYEAAKAADPECRFGLGANMDGARQFLQNHGADQLDTLGHVMQGSAHLRWPPMLEELEKAGKPDMPTFFPIFSVVRPSNSGPDHLQEERDSVRVMVTYWVSVLNSFPNVFSIKQYSLNWNGNQTHSLAHFNRVRPQFAAYAAMTNILGAGRFIEHHELPGAVMYVRERSARPGLVAILWSTGPEYGVPSDRSKDARRSPAVWGAEPEAVVKIEVGSESVELADVMGNRRTLATPGGVATIPLTPWPQYLIGASVLRPLP
ncbi:MAG: hypothetical protein EA424_18515, partial [Planctomycetaceae bacterium]